MSRRKEPAIPNELLDQLLAGGAASAAFEQGGLLDSLKKALTERALNAEMDHHLAGEDGAGNMRNGYGRKTVMTDTGKLAIDVPRDRQSSFDPQLIAKYQRRFPGFDDKIVSMYARGMSTREITAHLQEMFGAEVSPALISAITDTVADEVRAWQSRPLDRLYPILYLDCLMVKTREAGSAANRAIYMAIGVNTDGIKEVLGLWTAPTVRVARLSSSRQNNGDVRHGWWPASRSVHPCTGSLHHPGVNCLLGLDEGGKRIRGGGRGLCAERSETAAHIGSICSTVIANDVVCPRTVPPAESPTSSMSTPAASKSSAVMWS